MFSTQPYIIKLHLTISEREVGRTLDPYPGLQTSVGDTLASFCACA